MGIVQPSCFVLRMKLASRPQQDREPKPVCTISRKMVQWPVFWTVSINGSWQEIVAVCWDGSLPKGSATKCRRWRQQEGRCWDRRRGGKHRRQEQTNSGTVLDRDLLVGFFRPLFSFFLCFLFLFFTGLSYYRLKLGYFVVKYNRLQEVRSTQYATLLRWPTWPKYAKGV